MRVAAVVLAAAARSRCVFAFAAVLLATACGSSSERQTISSPSTVRCALQIETKNPAFAPPGGSGMLNISVDRECPWTAKSEASWVTLSVAEGQGTGSVPFTVASNADPSARTANIVANDQRLQITQQGKPCELSLSSNREAVDAAGGDRTVDVRASSSQCSWTASANVPWIAVTSGGEGRGSGVVRFRVEPATGPLRTGTLTIAGQTVHVDQGTGCSYSVGTDTFNVDPSGGERQVAVTAPPGCAWNAASNTAWITITRGSTGTGAGTVNFRVDATSGPARSGTLTIAGQTVRVDQGTGCSNSIGSETFNVDPSGGERQVAVTAPPGCAWTAASNTAWITVTSGSTGTGAGIVNFRVDATTGPARSGTLTVAGRTVTVVQSTGCNISVSPASFDQSAGGGTVTIAVEAGAGCPWSAATDVAWVTIAGAANGSGRGQVQAAVAANAGPARTGFVIVNGQRVAIRQATGCAYAVSPAAQQIAAGGGPAAGSVTTAPGCTWSATSAVNWITIPTPSGSGPGQVPFIVAPNDGPRRAGTLTIAGQVMTVNQASNCTWSFVPPNYDFDPNGGSANVLVLVAGACTWTGTSTVDWIRVTNIGMVVGGGVLQFSVAPNSGPARTGTIVIAGENYQVRQAGR